MHTRLLAVAIAAAFVSIVAADAAGQRAQREQQVVVTVIDREKVPVTTLAVADVTVRENDADREVLKVGPATAPLQLALILDNSAASGELIPDLRSAVRAFVTAMLAANAQTQIAIITCGERPTPEVNYTSSATALNAGIDRLFSRGGAGSYLLEAISEATKGLKARPAERRTIVVFANLMGPEFSSGTDRQVSKELQGVRAALWGVAFEGSGQPNSMAEETRHRASVLGDVTTRSGGTRETLLVASALTPKFKYLATLLTSQLAITYARPESLVPPERLEVRLKREDLRLFAPRWTGQ